LSGVSAFVVVSDELSVTRVLADVSE
jgi:hypothetical protein